MLFFKPPTTVYKPVSCFQVPSGVEYLRLADTDTFK